MGSTQFKYTRNIKLGPAIGDWTTIQFKDLDLDEINISSVRNINFDSLPRDEMKIVHMLHYRLAELITKKLSNDLTAKVELHSVQAKQMSYGEFLDSQQEQIVQSKYLLNDLGKTDVILDWSLSEMLVDRLLGGQGVPNGRENFSGIELKILKTQLEEIIPLFNQSWGNILGNQNVSDEFSSGAYSQDKKLSYREAYVLFSLNFYFIDQNLQTITFAYPNSVLKHLLKLKKSHSEPMKRRIKLDADTEECIKIPVKAVIGDATLTMSELIGLQIGDVIPLKSTLEMPMKVLIGGETSVTGQAGIINDQIAVQIIDLKSSKQGPKSQVNNVEKPLASDLGVLDDSSMSYAKQAFVDNNEVSTIEEPVVPSIPITEIESSSESLDEDVDQQRAFIGNDVTEEVVESIEDTTIDESLVSEPEEVQEEEAISSSEEDIFDEQNEDVLEEAPPTSASEPVEEPAESVEDADSEDDDDFSWDDLDDEF